MKIATFLVFYFATFVAASSALVWQVGGDTAWFANLITPSFAPPNWVFGPVWTLLYILMAVSAARLAYVREHPHQPLVMGLWALQISLNTIWTPVFFGSYQLGTAFIYIVLLLAALAVLIIAAWRVDKTSSILLTPYFAWVGFASVLNYSYWQLNG